MPSFDSVTLSKNLRMSSARSGRFTASFGQFEILAMIVRPEMSWTPNSLRLADSNGDCRSTNPKPGGRRPEFDFSRELRRRRSVSVGRRYAVSTDFRIDSAGKVAHPPDPVKMFVAGLEGNRSVF
jgi:hypothetical protein